MQWSSCCLNRTSLCMMTTKRPYTVTGRKSFKTWNEITSHLKVLISVRRESIGMMLSTPSSSKTSSYPSSTLASWKLGSEDKIDADSGHDPFPECNHCLRIVRDDVSSHQRGRDKPITFREERKPWSASQTFHDQCDTCTVREESGNPLCASCQHLRLEHLSFCMRADDLPANVPVPRSEANTTCPLCQVFDYIAEGKHSPEGRPLGYPLYLAATKWRDQEVQWRVTGEKWGWNSDGCAFLVVQRSQQGAGDYESRE
jgi:hypothetical protein